MTARKQLDREIKQALAGSRTVKTKARRRPEMETNTSDGGPGTSPPNRGELDIGKANERHKDLYYYILASFKRDE
jgi:hypothetical protein